MPLKRLATVRISNVDKHANEGQSVVRLCNYTDVYYRDVIRAEQDFMTATASSEQLRSFRLRAGDTLITKDSETADDIGVPAFVASAASDLVCGYHLAILRPSSAIVARFLYWVMASTFARGQLEVAATGVTRHGLRSDAIQNLDVPVPALGEQRAIADFLDAETARIDALIAKKRQQSFLVSERSMAEQGSLACGSTTSDGHRPSRIPWLASVPSHWLEQRLKFIAQVESGHTPSRSRPELWDDCRTPWVTLNDVGYLRTHEYVLATVNQISEAGLAASSARILPRNTVILSRDATVGRCGILGEPMATSQHFVNWICGPGLWPRYLWLLLNTAMQAYFASLTAGATLKTIGMPDVKSFMVPLPPLDEQQDIVLRAEHVRQSADRTVGLLHGQINLLRERRQALITAAVTGELDIPGAAA